MRARKIMEDAKNQEMEEDPEEVKQRSCRWLRRGRGAQMRFVVEDGVKDGQGDGETGQAQEAEGRERRPEEDSQVEQAARGDWEGVGEMEGAAVDRDQGSASGEGK